MCVFLHLQELCIDLEFRNRPALLSGGLSALFDSSEQVVHGPGNDAQLVLSDVDIEASSHGVRLPRTRLDREEKTGGWVGVMVTQRGMRHWGSNSHVTPLLPTETPERPRQERVRVCADR